MKKLMCEISVDEETLQEYYMGEWGIRDEADYCFKDAFNSEMGWLDESGIFLDDWRLVSPKCICHAEHFNTLNTATADYSGIEIALHKDGMLRMRAHTPEGRYSDVISINYCPICGRKLQKED